MDLTIACTTCRAEYAVVVNHRRTQGRLVLRSQQARFDELSPAAITASRELREFVAAPAAA
jgi:hypothetical protein